MTRGTVYTAIGLVAPFILRLEMRCEPRGEYVCYQVGYPGISLTSYFTPSEYERIPGRIRSMPAATFSWGIGSSLQSAFSEYVWVHDDGSVTAWGPESGEVVFECPSLDAYEAMVREQIAETIDAA